MTPNVGLPQPRSKPTVAQRIAARRAESARLHAGAVTAALPPPHRGACCALSECGERLEFADSRALIDALRRRRGIASVCLDGCAWRTFGSFWRHIRLGRTPHAAFECADIAGLGPRGPFVVH